MNRVWKISLKFKNGPKINRIIRDKSISIGSGYNSIIRLPKSYPSEILILEASENDPKLLRTKLKHKEAIFNAEKNQLTFDDIEILIEDITEDKKFNPINGERVSKLNPKEGSNRKTVWYFKEDTLLGTADILANNENFVRLDNGNEVRLDLISQRLVVKFFGGDIRSLNLKKIESGLEASFDSYVFMITDCMNDREIKTILPKGFKTRQWNLFPAFMMSLVASWLMFVFFFSSSQFTPEAPMEEVLPEELAKLEVERTLEGKKSGIKKNKIYREAGGGGNQGGNRQKGPGGKQGSSSVDRVVVKNKNFFKALGKGLKGSGVMGALANIDTKFKATGGVGAVAGIAPSGRKGGGGLGGILKALGGLGGGKGKGKGIGGIGTKGFGGGLGGGFGTGIGIGKGAGKGAGIEFGEGGTAIVGGLEKSEVNAVVKQNIAQIRYCYNRGLRMNPALLGKIVSSFVIGAEGKVTTSRIRSSTLGTPQVENCIRKKIASWKFPRPRGGGNVKVSYPFLLKPN